MFMQNVIAHFQVIIMFIWCHKNCTWLPLLPLAVVVVMLVGACTTYFLSVAQGHVAAIFPFIRLYQICTVALFSN